MKRKITKKNFWAGRKMLVLTIVCAMLLACMSGCGEKQEADVSEMTEKATDAEAEASEKVETNEAEVEENAEQTKEDFFKETVESWLIETGKQGIALAVWNEVDNTMYVIGEGEDYTRKEGDRFFMCVPSFLISFSDYSPCIYEMESSGMSMAEGRPNDNYCEVFFEESTRGKEEIDLRNITCQNGETGDLLFNLLEAGGAKEVISEIPEGCDYYLESSRGVKLLGAHTPEGFEDSGSYSAYLIWNGTDETIGVSADDRYKDIYDGITTEDSFEGIWDVFNGKENVPYTCTIKYTEKGTYDTIYGTARLFEEVTIFEEPDEEPTPMYSEIAIIKIKGEYVHIAITFREKEHDITWVLQQLFE